MPDGSPQLTQTWVDTDGEHVLINSVESHQKTRNIARDPRIALAVSDPSDPSSYVQIRGRVVRVTTGGGRSSTSRHSRRSTSAGPTRGSAAATRSA
ncbi:pyridoxamine 5'-phosphate oxidase family protein [Streptomyces sp. NPDC093223]|uniref:pyridoxamine 5'-phosphate oxidase family protein n=1 Tax=Streptomyces sp. NPDC093223 TaxID=3366033 RepID=UPI003810E974